MEVNPIKSEKDIKSIKKLLSSNKRDLFIFTLGINSGLRIGDLTKLKVSDFNEKGIGDTISLIEGKTGKTNFITINKNIYECFNAYMKTCQLNEDDFVFKSRKDGYSLHTNSVKRLIKSWCNQINLKGNYGAHTLRKTFGYHQMKNGTGIELLMKRFNHSSPGITLRYIGITSDDIKDICMNNL